MLSKISKHLPKAKDFKFILPLNYPVFGLSNHLTLGVTRQRLFQKCVVYDKLDIYVFISPVSLLELFDLPALSLEVKMWLVKLLKVIINICNPNPIES